MITTYNDRNYAMTTDGERVIVPDQVANNQHDYDGKVFRVMYHLSGETFLKLKSRLRGDLYGLDTPGVGDMIVELI